VQYNAVLFLDPGEPSGAYSTEAAIDRVWVTADPMPMEIQIDIKPGSDPNSINLTSAGVIPVAILGSPGFDATLVDPGTVSLAGAAVKMVGKGNMLLAHIDDVNGDGLLDLVCQVETAQFMIEPGEAWAVLEGQTFDGLAIRGRDSVRIVRE